MKKNISIFIFALIVTSIFTNNVSAQVYYLESSQKTYEQGRNIEVSLFIDTLQQQVNTLSAKIVVEKGLEIKDIRYGSSILTLWVDKPSINYKDNTIYFTGGLPGGYSGSRGQLLSFVVSGDILGTREISVKDTNILLNDGEGTVAQGVTSRSLKLSIIKKQNEVASNVISKVIGEDIVVPENFIPIISSNNDLGDGEYFVAFSAVDKDSGISHYDVEEWPWLISSLFDSYIYKETNVQSPYFLKYQKWANKIIIRAYDAKGNYTDASIFKWFSPIINILLIIILIILVILITFFVTKKVLLNNKRRR